MKNKLLFFLLLLFCTALSCSDLVEGPYVTQYYFPKGYTTEYEISNSIAYFRLNLEKGDSFDGLSLKSETNRKRFEEYSSYFGDNNYKQVELGSHQACILPIIGIAVTSDVDFGPHYKAGSLLNDLFSLRTRSFYEFIRHNYNEKYRLYEDSLASVDYSRLSLCQMGFVLSTSPTSLPQGDFKLIVDVQFGPDPVTGDSIVLPPAVFEVSNN